MRTPFILLLFLAFAAHGQTLTSVAVLPSDATGNALNDNELVALTDEMREAALKVLPTETFVLLKQDVVVKRLGGAENYIKECSESSCIVDLGKKAAVDYVSQASVIKLGSKIRLKVELYNVRTEGLVGMFNDEADDVNGLLAVVKNRVPEVFLKIEHPMPVLAPVPEPVLTLTPEPEPAPAPVSALAPEVKKPIKASFWVAIGLDVLGAAVIYGGYLQDKAVEQALNKYNIRRQTGDYYNDAWNDAKSSRNRRNALYVGGCVLLASGIGVHIWF